MRTDSTLTDIFQNEERQKRTDNSVVEVPALVRQIHSFRTKGYSIDNEEWEYGTRCVGAPIYDYRGKVVAAISTAWNSNRAEDSVENIGPMVRGNGTENFCATWGIPGVDPET